MDLVYSAEEIALRDKIREWLATNVPRTRRPPEGKDAAEFDQAWQRRLFDGGFAGISWPAAYGGAGLSPFQLVIWLEEAARANAPHPGAMGIALNHAGPTLIVRGSEAQKKIYLQPILRGETIWCQGFSEPGAGSDLAALTTRADIEGDHLVVNGQKMWTSNAHHATYQELLVRTDPASKRHKGLTWVICDMSSPGLEIKPIKNMMGERHVNMVFYDNVRIPLTNVVGGIGEGWSVAMSTLSFERAIYFMPEMLSLVRKVEALICVARRTRLEDGRLASEDDAIAAKLAAVKAKTLALRAVAVTIASRLTRQGQPGPEGSMIKLYVTTTYKEIAALAAEILGWNFLEYGEDRTSNIWTYEYMWSWILTISGGSSEIQREIIADHVLNLPRAR
jgi:alkylation response protein AidB-like acyl-CoA dehydrogenase